MLSALMARRCKGCFDSHKKCDHVSLSHFVIPDVQARGDVSLEHLTWIGKYIALKRPEVIVQIGDFADMPSLSSYDRGKKSFEGRRYKADIDATHRAMDLLMAPLAGVLGYKPRMVLTLGNHEDRITRATEEDAKLDGTIGLADLKYEDWGWEVIPYLKPIKIDGIDYAHYFTTGVLGRPCSSAAVMLRERMGSAIAGHVQKFDMAVHQKTGHIAMMVGVCYLHDEPYLGNQGNNCRRQIVVLHEVRNGIFDPMLVSLDYLKRRFT